MRSNVELRVGVLVILAITATSFWLLFLKEFKFRTATFPVYVEFAQVKGIGVGAPVNILGVERGKVEAIDLKANHVRLTLQIEEGTFIAQDARFLLQSDFFDPTSIRIVQGHMVEPLEPGSKLQGHETLGLGQVMSETSALLSKLNGLASRADSLTADGRLDRMLGELDQGARELTLWTADGRRETQKALARIESLSRQIEEMVAENREPLHDALTGVSQASHRADTLMVSLGELSEGLNRVVTGIESGQGTLGRLYESPALHDSLTLTVARLDSLIQDIKENPKKYISFELF